MKEVATFHKVKYFAFKIFPSLCLGATSGRQHMLLLSAIQFYYAIIVLFFRLVCTYHKIFSRFNCKYIHQQNLRTQGSTKWLCCLGDFVSRSAQSIKFLTPSEAQSKLSGPSNRLNHTKAFPARAIQLIRVL